jgi:acetylornithine deacetylase
MDTGLFLEILNIPSTSGSERSLAEFLQERLPFGGCLTRCFEVGDGTLNMLLDWSGTGSPSFVFCTHIDTVPPYIPPAVVYVSKGDILPDGRLARQDGTMIKGRGSCDAKGQIFAMYEACRRLRNEGFTDFGLLLLSGEETGSFGAKTYSKDCPGGAFVLVGEPTDNCLVTASKGTKAFGITIRGKACHSGYPQHGESAVDRFVDFIGALRAVDFPQDPVLGPTTWNVGKLASDNPQNILSPEVRFRLYFRTTFATDATVGETLSGICPDGTAIEAFGGDSPLEYFHGVDGIPSKPVSFGSDAPRLTKFPGKAICGPGSILTAHTDNEYVLLEDIETSVRQYVRIFKEIN